MKKILVLVVVLLCLFKTNLICQSPKYITLNNLDGLIATNDELISLEEKSFLFGKSLGPEFENDFAVYEASLYLHNRDMSEDINYWIELQENKINSKYYALFIVIFQNDVETIVRVKTKLPSDGKFQCILDQFPQFELTLSSLCQAFVKDRNSIFKEIGEAISFASETIKDRIDCCTERKDCPLCLFNSVEIDNEIFYDASEITDKLEGLGFIGYPFETKSDAEFIRPEKNPSFRGVKEYERSVSPLNINVSFGGQSEINLNDFVQNVSSAFSKSVLNSTGVSMSPSTYTYKFPRDLCKFEILYNQFTQDANSSKIFFAVVNVGGIGVLFIKTEGSSENFQRDENYNKREEFANLISDQKDEWELFKESYQIANNTYFQDPCGNYIFNHTAKITSKLSAEIGLVISKLSGANKKYAQIYYDEQIKNINNHVKTANFLWDMFYHREEAMVEVEFKRDHWIISTSDFAAEIGIGVITKGRLCIELIHATLEACGLGFPVCDGINSILYISEGKYGAAALSAVGVLPLAKETIFGTKLWQPAGETAVACAIGGRSLKKCIPVDVLKWGNGRIDWIGKHKSLKEWSEFYFDELNALGKFRIFGEMAFEASKRIQWHHVIPWGLHTGTNAHSLLQKLGKYGKWQSYEPNFNSLPLPSAKEFLEKCTGCKDLDVISRFHANHPRYSEYVKKLLDDLESKIGEIGPGNADKAFKEVVKITENLKDEIVKAYKNYELTGVNLEAYFKSK